MFGKKFFIDTITATLFIFFVMFGLGRFLGIFDVLDPIGDALEDVELTDLVFSQLKPQQEIDTNIVLVNIGTLNRAQLAAQINILNKYQPKVIGIDSYFYRLKEGLGDTLLAEALNEVENLVMLSKLIEYNEETDTYDSLARSHPLFLSNAITAYANLDTDAEHQDDFKAVRRFPPKWQVGDHEEHAYAVKLAEIYQPQAGKKALSRNYLFEEINFKGNMINPYHHMEVPEVFRAIDIKDLFEENFDPTWVKDKIVIMGYLGLDFKDTDWDDKFYTPLNPVFAGKVEPDMYGAVVHANAVAMILDDNYIDTFPDWVEYLLAIILCYINVFFFTIIYVKLDAWYDGLTKVIQLAEAAFFLILIVWLFWQFQFKLNLTIGIIAVLLAGDALEVYYGIILNLFSKEGRAIIKQGKKVRALAYSEKVEPSISTS